MSSDGEFNPHVANALLFLGRAFGELLKNWDGRTERLAFFIDFNEIALVGYCTDDYAAKFLRDLLRVLQDGQIPASASTRLGGASRVAEVAHQLGQHEPCDRVRLLVLGWGLCNVFHLDAAKWRAAARASSVANKPASPVSDSGSAEQVARQVHDMLALLEARGFRTAELDHLKRTLAVRSEDFAAMTLAIARARGEVATFSATPEGKCALKLLDILAESIARRSVGPWNALGGNA